MSVLDRGSGVVLWQRRYWRASQADARFERLQRELTSSTATEFARRYDPDASAL